MPLLQGPLLQVLPLRVLILQALPLQVLLLQVLPLRALLLQALPLQVPLLLLQVSLQQVFLPLKALRLPPCLRSAVQHEQNSR